MKVFSKGYKNKSTPSLNTLANITQPIPTAKPKSTNKLKTFKQILTQNVQITALRSEENAEFRHNENKTRPKTERNRAILNLSSDNNSYAEFNSFQECTPAIKMISSINIKNVHTDADIRSSSESV